MPITDYTGPKKMKELGSDEYLIPYCNWFTKFGFGFLHHAHYLKMVSFHRSCYSVTL